MQKTEVSGTPKPLGQDVLKDQPEKHLTFDPTGINAALIVAISERDMGPIIMKDIAFTDHPSIQVTRQIFQGG